MKKCILLFQILFTLQGCFNANINQINNNTAPITTAEAINNSTQKLSFNSISFSYDKKNIFYSKNNNSYDNFFGVTSIDESYWIKNIDNNALKKLADFKLEKNYYLENRYWLNNDSLILIFSDKETTRVIKYDNKKNNFIDIFKKKVNIDLIKNNNLYFIEDKKLKKFSLLNLKETQIAEIEGEMSWNTFYINNNETIIVNEIGVSSSELNKFKIKVAPPPYYNQSIINLNNKTVKSKVTNSSDKGYLFKQNTDTGFSDDGLKLGTFSNKKIEIINIENEEILFKKDFNEEQTYIFASWINNNQFIYKENNKLFIYDLEKKSELKTIELPQHFTNYFNIHYSGQNLILERNQFISALNLSDYSIKTINNIFNSSDTVLSNYLPEINQTIFSKSDSNNIYTIDENSSMKQIATLN